MPSMLPCCTSDLKPAKYFIGRRDLAGFFAAGATVEFATVIETPKNIDDHCF